MPERRLGVNEIARAARRVYGPGAQARVLAEEILMRFQGKGWEVLGYEDAAQFDETARFELEEPPKQQEIGGNLGGNLGGSSEVPLPKVAIPYVENHHSSYRYRRRVPPDVRKQIGKTSWVLTWRKRVPLSRIEHEAKTLAETHDRLIDRVRAGDLIDPDRIAEIEHEAQQDLARGRLDLHRLLGQQAEAIDALGPTPGDKIQGPYVDIEAYQKTIATGGVYRPDSLPLSIIYDQDKERYGGNRDETPVRVAIESFIAFAGDLDIREISRAKVEDWLRHLGVKQKPATVNRRLKAIRAVVQRAYLRLELDQRNPFREHKIEGGAGTATDRLPLNREMVAKVDAYLAKSKRLGHETINLIHMIKGTGAGPGEIGGLALSDVVLDHAVPHVRIRPNAIRGLQVKSSGQASSSRERHIPLIGETLEAAKDAYQKALVRSKGQSPDEAQVFASYSREHGANPISAKLLKCIRAAGVPKSTRLVVYSYRHTLEEALRSAHTPEHIQKRILGHADSTTTDRYGSPMGRLAETRDALVKAMEHFGDVEESIYRSDERV